MPFTLNQYSYCFNSPLILVDLDGTWPKWVETAAKVVTVGVAAVAVGAVVVGTGGLAVTIVAGAAVGGVVGGFANENAGGSYINGWVGGAVAGGIQAAAGYELGPLGTIFGGAANGVGSAITDFLDNFDSYNNKYKTIEQIGKDAVKTAGRGIICSIPGGIMQWMVNAANAKDSVARALMPYTVNFGGGLDQFYGILDNLLLAGWSEEDIIQEFKSRVERGMQVCLE